MKTSSVTFQGKKKTPSHAQKISLKCDIFSKTFANEPLNHIHMLR